MTPTERAELRRKWQRYEKGGNSAADHRNLRAMLAAAVPGLLDEIDRMERRVPPAEVRREWP